MYDKYSEMHLRQEKVNKLKSKLLAEIDEELKKVFMGLREFYEPEIDKEWVIGTRYSQRLHNLFVLKHYLEYERSFMDFHNIYEEQDIIVYKLSDRMLDIYSNMDMALIRILTALETSGGIVEEMMDDQSFEHGLLTTLEIMIEEKKLGAATGD